tara:strand:- start:628 stop:786 length:159 start_codon:yes stop_codon:yes gene_type:complete
MDENYIKLNKQIKHMISNIIFKQNLDLIKKISQDYNRDYNLLIRKYNLGKYD